jgi:hypothetical protein
LKAIGAGFSIAVCFFYLGCGGVQMANAAHGSNVAALTIATQLVPSAVVGTPYVLVLDATGGTPGYSWSVTAGQLPPGVSLASSTGIVSGSPTASGKYSAQVTLSDASTPADKKSSTITISVAAPPLAIVTSGLPTAFSSAIYSGSLQATGGTGGYTWSISSGDLPPGLMLSSSTGAITGLPRSSGVSTFTATVRDGEKPAKSSSQVITLTVDAAPLRIATLALPAETNDSLYSQTLNVNGGTPGYAWSILSGSLPLGLTLNPSTGTISGMPAGGQSATFTAAVTDRGNPVQTTSASFTIAVPVSPLSVASTVLPSLAVGTSYSQTLQASGGTAPYNWSVAFGSLPNGIALSSTGVISGTPTASGSFTFRALVVDSGNPVQTVAVSRTITVAASPLKVTAPTIPTVHVGTGVSQSFAVSGGTAAYKWQITSGNLPAGLSLTSSGVISGVVTQSGAATFTATATDSSTPAQTASATAAIVVTPNPLIITSSTLPGVGVGNSYSQTLQASGGSAPYTWSITAGSLPSGLNFAPSTGTISGVAAASSASAVTFTVTDSSSPAQVTSAAITLPVAPAALSIVPASLAAYTKGTAYAQSLQATGGTVPYKWSVTSGSLPTGLSLSATGVISGNPTSTSSASFAVTVTDSGSPAQVQSASLGLAATAPPKTVATATPLSIVGTSLAPATAGTAYTQSLQAAGGTPGYTWAIASGSLPAGLTMAATTGTISGIPSTAGTSTFTAVVSDNGSPAQTQTVSTSLTVAAPQATAATGHTWYIRPDGGTRYSTNQTAGQCDGLADAPYPGTGTNQHCGFNDFRFMWDDQSYNSAAWVMSGGDTVIIEGCHANAQQMNPHDPDCRIGWDENAWGGEPNFWCLGGGYYGQSSFGCYSPPIPAGTASQHTRILGANYQNCSVNNQPDLTKTAVLFGGFSLLNTFTLASTQYVDVQCLHITSHNSTCNVHGIPAFNHYCANSSPFDDYDGNGILVDAKTANVTLQDVSIDGHTTAGIFGPIGANFTMNRVFVGFNGFAGWNFDDGHDDQNGANASINANYVTMEGNGCYKQWPITNPQFPARACYDDVSGGFGDSWSGQDSTLVSFTCNHCQQFYNTKDGFIGPHTQVTTLLVENSYSYGNMGQQWKWNNTTNASTTFVNNLTIGNCGRMSEMLPGAAQSFGLSSGLNGAYLSDYCRAAGDTFSFSTQANSTILVANNTVVSASNTIFDLNCGPAGGGAGTCGSTSFLFKDNIYLGYSPYGTAPGLYYISDSSDVITSTNNVEYGVRSSDNCGGTIICSSPLLVNQPSQTWADQTQLDNFNFNLSSSSPAIGVGVAVSGITTDYNGVTRANPPGLGAVTP